MGLLGKAALLTAMVALVIPCESSWVRAAESGTVTGTVTYLQRIALPPDAVVSVQLLNVSLQDVPAKVLAEVELATEGKQVPIAFQIRYKIADINPAHSYAVRANIRAGGEISFTSSASYPVITRGAPVQIEILVQPVSTTRPANAKPLQPARASPFTASATFAGDLPCADCAGIQFTLTLRADGIFLSRTEYLGRGKRFYDLGRWSLQNDGNRLVLRSGKEAPQQYAVTDADTLRRLDIEGHEIVSKLNYNIKRAAKVDPMDDSFSMTGEFVYMANAGLLTECRTGARWPVAQENQNAALERAYSTSGVEAGKPLLVAFDGHLRMRPKMEGSGEQEMIVVDKFVRVFPTDQKCPVVATQLGGTNWKLIELGGAPVAAGPAARQANLVLSVDGKSMSGSTGCNRIVGTYELEKDTLRFQPAGLTMMACLDPFMKQEQAFIEALKAASNFRIVGATLELRNAERVLARFEANAS